MDHHKQDHVEILPDQIVPLHDIAAGLKGLRITFVNIFGIAHNDGSWTLIDAGIPGSGPLIRAWAERTYQRPPEALVLTHGHFDHVGAAILLAEEWNIPVYAHTLELPFLNGSESYPVPNFSAGGGLMTLLSPLYPREPIDLGGRLHAISTEGESIPCLPGWSVLHTPGHTPGHISLYRSQDRTLIVGDAFCSTKPEAFFEAAVLQQPELHGPPAYFTSDWAAARASVERLAQLAPQTVALGHGKPLSGTGVAGELATLAKRFTELAVPANVRYAATP